MHGGIAAIGIGIVEQRPRDFDGRERILERLRPKRQIHGLGGCRRERLPPLFVTFQAPAERVQDVTHAPLFGRIHGHPEPDRDGARGGREAGKLFRADQPQHAAERFGVRQVDGLEDHLPQPLLPLRGKQQPFDHRPRFRPRAAQQRGDGVPAHVDSARAP